ncbi:MAG: ribonuclease H-like domain-containing protein [Candidatus Latescibacterota bacterium]
MLTHTFCHVAGIGPALERRLWGAGVETWQAADLAAALPLPTSRGQALRTALQESAQELASGNARYFGDRLAARELWRLLPHFASRAAYLDIETTGLGGPGDIVTTAVLYDGRAIHSFVRGRNLDDLGPCVAQYELLVTYNGACFDLPFLRNCLGLPLTQAHIDLRYVLGSLGYRGGLKGCERQLGLGRGDLADVDGFFAVLLWREFQSSRDPRVLETLLAYNTLDVVHLERLAVLAYNRKLEATPFPELCLPLPPMPGNPFVAHSAVVERVKRKYCWR